MKLIIINMQCFCAFYFTKEVFWRDLTFSWCHCIFSIDHTFNSYEECFPELHKNQNSQIFHFDRYFSVSHKLWWLDNISLEDKAPWFAYSREAGRKTCRNINVSLNRPVWNSFKKKLKDKSLVLLEKSGTSGSSSAYLLLHCSSAVWNRFTIWDI